MASKIEIHLLQSFPPANLNRDDNNSPKDCEFGGVRRARISSQCLKRTIRLHPEFERVTGVQPADRTRLLAGRLQSALETAGKPAAEAEMVAVAFTAALLGGMDDKAPEKSKVLFYISAAEVDEMVRLLTEDWEKSMGESVPPSDKKEDKAKAKKSGGRFAELIKGYRKAFGNRSSAPDIAMFGRMLAEDPELNLEAACQVAHAISTHKVNMETDFYTAVADLQPEGTTGAGMMGLTAYNSATYYRYAAIDWGQLLTNLGGNADLALRTVQGFLRAAVRSVPTGKQNSFAAQTPPALLLVVVRSDGQAWSLANAFEKPVTARDQQGYLAGSVQALVQQWRRLERAYGDPDLPAQAFALAVDESLDLGSLVSEDSLGALEVKVMSALSEV